MSLAGLSPRIRGSAEELVQLARARGLNPQITSVRRSRAQQARLYRRYLAGLSPYPAAPPGHSKHELGLAFDMVVSDMSQLAALGRIWEQAGGRWGGRFNDPIHFEA